MAWLGATSADRPGDITRGSHPAYWSFVHSLPRRANLLPSTTILHPPAMIFNPTRLKVQLKLSINRLKMLQSKKSAQNQHQRREIAHLLEAGKEESARIRVEGIIREDFLMEAMEILELYCELLLARFGLLEQMKNCDPAIAEAVNTIIYSAPRMDQVKELGSVRDQLVAKFGKDFALAALENQNDVVNSRIISKLQINTPDPYLVTRYLEEIAKSYSVRWTSDGGADDDDDDGGLAELRELDDKLPDDLSFRQDIDLLGDIPSTPSSQPLLNPTTALELNLPDIPVGAPTKKKPVVEEKKVEEPKEDVPDFDELTRRFEALKKKR
ncbi:regulator of Vps4 activity in the MVB pathway-domain-containing protein [Jimgerdemannia flammicorona]|uniref:Regulator of Vps4 activity in the MVB pathway-domain-containing protein n=1 Tax=Jimgerdemannia flammicorona TaxID=994334 RepID=A0A433Q5J7_9FUNG|nr:regulator of Vps4 activity in the MVB pathway-domain-containing protein [Jimgerdemannia flammicorona]